MKERLTRWNVRAPVDIPLQTRNKSLVKWDVSLVDPTTQVVLQDGNALQYRSCQRPSW